MKVNGNRARKLEEGELELLYLNVTLQLQRPHLPLSLF